VRKTTKPGPIPIADPAPAIEEATPNPPEPPEPHTPADSADADEPAAPEPPEPPAPRKKGRPKADDQAESGFWSRLTQISAADWERHVMYCYRRQPKIDRKQTGNPYTYLCKYTEPIDIDRILQDHGSGEYRLTLNWVNPVNSNSVAKDAFVFQIVNPSYPPKIPAGEWVDDQCNREWKQLFPQLGAAIITPQAAAAAAPPQTGPTFQEVTNLVREAVKGKESDPGPKAETILEAVRTGMTMMQGNGKQDASAESTVTAILRDALKETRDELRSTRDQLTDLLTKQPGPKSFKDELAEFVTMRKLMKDLDDEEKPNPMLSPEAPWWAGPLTAFAEQLAPVVGAVVTGAMMQRQQQRQQQQQPGDPAARNAAQPVQVMQPQAAQQAQTPQQPRTIPPEVLGMMSTALRFCAQGKTGEDFGDWLQQADDSAIARLRGLATENASAEEAIIEFAKSVPMIWNQIVPVPAQAAEAEARFRTFVQEVLMWTPPEDDGPESDDEPEEREASA
jgi:hypothetical protein